jgi:two-component system, LytTR family, sensor kinase
MNLLSSGVVFFYKFDFKYPKMKSFLNIINKRWIKHLAFWVFILFFHISRSNFNFVGYSWKMFYAELAEHSLMLPILMIASYFTSYYLIPRVYYTKRYLLFGLLLLGSGVLFIFMMRLLLYYIIMPFYYSSYLLEYPDFFQFNVFQHAFYIYSTVAIVLMIKLSQEWYSILKQKEQLSKQNLISELALLRTQINPHFLFNTLNNINALVKKDPDKTHRSIVKLSEIMRYMLYDASKEKTLLIKEIEYIESLIGLQLLRLSDHNFISFEIQGNPYNYEIAPMLFVPFVENAFKHANKDVSSPGIIIRLQIDGKSLIFTVKNYKRKYVETVQPDYKGIGISNVKRRLQLLYPERHQFSINETENEYMIFLALTL